MICSLMKIMKIALKITFVQNAPLSCHRTEIAHIAAKTISLHKQPPQGNLFHRTDFIMYMTANIQTFSGHMVGKGEMELLNYCRRDQ